MLIVTSLQYHLSPSISNSSSNKNTPPTHLPISISAPNTNTLCTALSAAHQVLFPLHCALPPPYRHGSLPKDYHLVCQIPIHPLLTSHTFCYLLELVLHHPSFINTPSHFPLPICINVVTKPSSFFSALLLLSDLALPSGNGQVVGISI